MAYGQVMDALGDPTRRAVLELLRRGPRAVGDLAEHLPVSRPAVSQHLRILKDAGLVRVHPDGSRHLYAVEPKGLEEARRYLERYWDAALQAFADATEEDP